MKETPEQQRKRLEVKRLANSTEPLIKCLECSMHFVRVGSHVVQVHGYTSVAEYRKEHGLLARETALYSHRLAMSKLASTKDNLLKGKSKRFKKGDRHGQVVTNFWNNRELKYGSRSR